MNPKETCEPSEEELQEWLKTPDGNAVMREVMREVMRKTVSGEFWKVRPEMLALAQQRPKYHEAEEEVREIQLQLEALKEKTKAPLNGSRWQRMQQLNEAMKDIMDLIMEQPEPQRTALMKMVVPVQQDLAELEKQY